MTNILVVFASDYGNTEKMAQAAAEGAATVNGTNVTVKQAEETKADDWTTSNGVLLGSPVHMGSMDWRVKNDRYRLFRPLDAG